MTSPVQPPSRPPAGGDWPAQVTDAVVNLVDSVKDRTTGPATSVARGAVYGLLASIVGTAFLVLFLVFVFRLVVVGTDAILDLADLEKPGRAVWIAHTIMGLTILILGVLVWRKALRAPAD